MIAGRASRRGPLSYAPAPPAHPAHRRESTPCFSNRESRRHRGPRPMRTLSLSCLTPTIPATAMNPATTTATAGEADVHASTRTVRIRIRRQDGPDKPPRWEEFDVPHRPNMNIISALQWIVAHPRTVDGRDTTPPVWDSACLEEVCGACTMLINGKTRQSCSALVDKLEQPITLEPMTKFPLVRDLFVDRSRLFNDLKKV